MKTRVKVEGRIIERPTPDKAHLWAQQNLKAHKWVDKSKIIPRKRKYKAQSDAL